MSLHNFVTNVINLAAESCLILDIPSILGVETIAAIPDDRLREIAAESEASRKERQRLDNEIAILRRALQRCQHEAAQLRGNNKYPFLFLLSITIVSLTRNSDIYNLPAADSLQSGDTNNEGENRAVTSAAVVNDPPEDSTGYRPFDTSSTGLCDISGRPFFSADYSGI